MIEKLLYDPNCWDCYKQSIEIASKEEIVMKINEIIDYLNDTSKTTKRTYMSTKTGAIIDD